MTLSRPMESEMCELTDPRRRRADSGATIRAATCVTCRQLDIRTMPPRR
jgi:hypothetical protein